MATALLQRCRARVEQTWYDWEDEAASQSTAEDELIAQTQNLRLRSSPSDHPQGAVDVQHFDGDAPQHPLANVYSEPLGADDPNPESAEGLLVGWRTFRQFRKHVSFMPTASLCETAGQGQISAACSVLHMFSGAAWPSGEQPLGTDGTSWLVLTKLLLHQELREEQQRQEDQRIFSKVDIALNPNHGRARCEGDRRLKALNEALDGYPGWKRSQAQRMFHTAFTNAILPQIYGDEWDVNEERVLREQSLREIQREVMIITPRRYGKTVAVAMWSAAVVATVPGAEIGIFSTGMRASMMLMQLTAKFLRMIKGATNRIVEESKLNLTMSQKPLPPGFGPQSTLAQEYRHSDECAKLHCYPSAVNSE